MARRSSLLPVSGSWPVTIRDLWFGPRPLSPARGSVDFRPGGACWSPPVPRRSLRSVSPLCSCRSAPVAALPFLGACLCLCAARWRASVPVPAVSTSAEQPRSHLLTVALPRLVPCRCPEPGTGKGAQQRALGGRLTRWARRFAFCPLSGICGLPPLPPAPGVRRRDRRAALTGTLQFERELPRRESGRSTSRSRSPVSASSAVPVGRSLHPYRDSRRMRYSPALIA